MNRILEIFENNNKLSFKRVSGLISLIFAMCIAYMGYSVEVVSLFVAYSGAMGGVGIFDVKKGK
jgi:uncharacterized membrane protein